MGRLPTSNDIPVDCGRYLHAMATDTTPEQRGQFLAEHAGWHLEGETITKTFAFGDFNGAMGFVTRIALAAEVADHHPDIDVRYRRVTLVLSTHSAGGLTGKDFALARRVDGLS